MDVSSNTERKERWREWGHELNDEQKMGVELYDEGGWDGVSFFLGAS